MKDEYMPRLFDEILEFSLKTKGAVVVTGPKWCGKSCTTKRQAKTIIDLMPRQTRKNIIDYAEAAPHEFLNDGEKPMLIDEWQHISFIWDDIKVEVDDAGEFGLYILTGSVTDKQSYEDYSLDDRHTGNGRIVRKMMRPMTLFESGESNGKVSIRDLMNGKFTPCFSKPTIKDYAFYICRGGWPLAINKDREIALQQAIDYYDTVITDDIFSIKSIPIRHDEFKARQVMRSYARNISIAASDQTILEDCVSDETTFDEETLSKYLEALRYLFVIEELPAWNPNLRSKTAIITKPTRHFVDPSIATSALGISPEGLFKDMVTFGFLFESLAVRDLRVYADVLGAKLYKYRDSKKREADIVMQFRNGDYALIEVKLGGEQDVEDAARKLAIIRDDIDEEKTGKPAFLMVITKGNTAIKRKDGVYVVPLGCLKP